MKRSFGVVFFRPILKELFDCCKAMGVRYVCVEGSYDKGGQEARMVFSVIAGGCAIDHHHSILTNINIEYSVALNLIKFS